MRRRPSNPGQRPFMLSGDALKRIAAAVQSYEHGDRKQSPIKFRTAAGDDGGEFVRLGRISEDWPHGEEATVEQLDQDGSAFDPPRTFQAINYFTTVYVGNITPRNVACGLVDDTWVLIEAWRGCESAALAKDLDSAASDSSTASQISPGDGAEALLNDYPCARWVGLTRFTVLTDARIDGNSLVFSRAYLWAFADSDEGGGPGDITIDGTECEFGNPE